MSVVTLTSKGQVTLPAEVRKKLNLKEGDTVKFEALDGKVILSKVEAFEQVLANTLSEWDSESDDEAYSDL